MLELVKISLLVMVLFFDFSVVFAETLFHILCLFVCLFVQLRLQSFSGQHWLLPSSVVQR